jgi:NAD(P)-dependent dehydrogenase (short-subunit alcohol dehydrogenase family)
MDDTAVVVTGASTGIGRATALHLDSLGLRVFAGVRREKDGASLRGEASPRLTPIRLDVTDPGQVAEAARQVGEAVPDSRLVGIVNNAGIAVAGPVEFVPLKRWRDQLEINVIGTVSMVQAFVPLLRESCGRIVTIGSLGSAWPNRWQRRIAPASTPSRPSATRCGWSSGPGGSPSP